MKRLFLEEFSKKHRIERHDYYKTAKKIIISVRNLLFSAVV